MLSTHLLLRNVARGKSSGVAATPAQKRNLCRKAQPSQPGAEGNTVVTEGMTKETRENKQRTVVEKGEAGGPSKLDPHRGRISWVNYEPRLCSRRQSCLLFVGNILFRRFNIYVFYANVHRGRLLPTIARPHFTTGLEPNVNKFRAKRIEVRRQTHAKQIYFR